MKVCICVDAGGTSTKVAIFDCKGEVLTTGVGKLGSPAVDIQHWYQHIDDAIQLTLSKLSIEQLEVEYIEIGVSGISALSSHKKVDDFFEKKYQTICEITSDTVTALYSVIEENDTSGIVVISGTGVAIYGEHNGKSHLIGGWGHLIRECGSAYAIVHDLAVEMIDKYESGEELDQLEKGFLKALDFKDIRDLNHLFYQHTKDEIAKWSRYIKSSAKKGDLHAKNLLYAQGVSLGKQVEHLIHWLSIPQKTKIGLRGGFLEYEGQYIIKGIYDYFKQNNIELTFEKTIVNQMVGVYRRACYNMRQNRMG
ncbi:MAG: hypothetical protein NC182_07130 [Prevotella sp.]|nr:hypothetical protein [Staphylococcus sp.]MCM1350954.1 hypothetical protein [Prevotella sp.]